MERDPRTERMEIRATKDEAEEIRAAAKSEGMQVAQFIRFAAIWMARL